MALRDKTIYDCTEKSFFADNFVDRIHDMLGIIISKFDEIDFIEYNHILKLYHNYTIIFYIKQANLEKNKYPAVNGAAGYYQHEKISNAHFYFD